MGRPKRPNRAKGKGRTDGSDSLPLLQLPDALLLAVLRCCADDPASWASAARAHSRLHQAAVLALTSITADVADDEEQLDSLLLYLERHGQHVDSIHLTGDCDVQSICYDDYDSPVSLRQLPSILQLRSLECSNMGVRQLRQQCDDGFQLVLEPGAPLKQLRLSECLLDGRAYMEEEMAAALVLLPELEHLCIQRCMSEGVYDNDEPTAFFCTSDMFEKMQQLTYLELADVWLHPSYALELPAQLDMQALTRLVDLRLKSMGGDSVSAEMLSGVCRLTRLELSEFDEFDAAVLAGKTLLQHLALPSAEAEAAELLSQLQAMQQLTHLDLTSGWAAFRKGGPPAAAFSALTASSNLQHLDISWCTVPAGAWQHMFPADRQLPHLRVLDIAGVTLASGKRGAAPARSRLASCCPMLEVYRFGV